MSYDIDVFSIESDEKIAFINFLHVVNGTITQSFTFEFKKKLDENDETLLALGIVEMRERFFVSIARNCASPSSWNFPRDMPNRWYRKWAESVRSSIFHARM